MNSLYVLTQLVEHLGLSGKEQRVLSGCWQTMCYEDEEEDKEDKGDVNWGGEDEDDDESPKREYFKPLLPAKPLKKDGNAFGIQDED